VIKYNPWIIVFYAGDNDIAAAKKAEQVFGDYKKFVNLVKKELPNINKPPHYVETGRSIGPYFKLSKKLQLILIVSGDSKSESIIHRWNRHYQFSLY
jgi:ABC-type Fe3+-hydroxamate transport system substrate-binding protein